MNSHLKKQRVVMAIACAAIIAGCTTVPVTGRRGLHLIPNSELTQLSLSNYQQTIAEATLSKDAEAVATVNRVGNRIAEATESYLRQNGYSTESYHWEFNVIEDDEMINAWAMPGGKVAVYTGLLPVAQDDAGLAAVMGHEIAHVLAGHGNERMSQGLLVQLGGATLSAALRERPGMTRDLLMASYGAGSQLGVMLPYSRLHESEADHIGIILMAIAGYDPRAAVAFWGRMNAESGSRPPEFLSTHPAPQTRIADLERRLPEAMAIYQGPR